MEEKMSRQRRWQLKKRSLGLCENCGEPTSKGIYCRECGIKRKTVRRNKTNYKPWVPGGRGRPPIYK